MTSNNLNRFQIISLINSKMLFGIILFILVCLSPAYAQGNLTQYKSSPASSDEVLKIINNPQNQNDVELIMFVLKSIEYKNIKDINKKIDFVDTFKVSDDIKDVIKTTIKQNLNYSDHERVDYGIYQLKKECNHNSSSGIDSYTPLEDYIYYPSVRRCLFNPGSIC